MVAILVLGRLDDLAGGGGGSSFSSLSWDEGSICDGMNSAGVGGMVAVDPLLTVNVREGGFASRDRLRETIRLLGRCSTESLRRPLGDGGASSCAA